MTDANSGSVLLFGSYDATLHPRVAVLRDGLAANGWAVEELNVPLGASTADKVAAAGSARSAAALAGKQLRSWRRLIAGARAGRPDPDVVVVGYLGHADVHLAKALFRHSTIVLDHLVGLADTVGDRQLGGSAKQRALGSVDRAALRAADLIVVDTEEQAHALPSEVHSRAVVVPVGAGEEWYAAARPAAVSSKFEDESGPQTWMKSDSGVANLDEIKGGVRGGGGDGGGAGDGGDAEGGDEGAEYGPAEGVAAQSERAPLREDAGPLRVVFFGLFTPLQGTPTIARAIDLVRDEPIEFTMIGTGQDHAEAVTIVGSNDRVRWIDWVPSERLPTEVAGHDVCLGVFGTGPKTQRVVPTKVYQGLAAGCAVVTGETAAVAELGNAVLRVPCGDPDALAGLLRDLAADHQRLAEAKQGAREAAQRFTPQAATADLAERLAQPTPARRLPPLSLNAWLRWDVIQAELDRLPATDVLEIGPGEGAGACRLARGRDYTGVELSDRTRPITEARLAAQGTPGRLVASLDDLAPDEQFDLVCAFEVIEHIEDDRSALATWRTRVRPGGAILISTPNHPERMGPHDEVAGHFRRYSPEGLAALARDVGFVDVEVIGVGYPFGYALEAFRNRAAARRFAQQSGVAAEDADVAARTERSSSIMQPPAWSGTATRVASAPGRWLQRRWPDRGTGLVMVARAPR